MAQIALIGPNHDTCTPEIYAFGIQLGQQLVNRGHVLICGGSYGLMEAVFKGAREARNYRFGSTIGILPGSDKQDANPYCDVVIPTRIGYARNSIVVSSGDIVVATAGGSGTLSEIAYAWSFGKPVIACSQFGGWSGEMGGKALDHRRQDQVDRATTLDEVIEHVDRLTSDLNHR